MTSSQVLLGFILFSVGYATAIQLFAYPYPVYTRGKLKCDDKPLPGAEVTLQVVYNDTGRDPPPPTKPHVDVVTLNSNTTDGNGDYLLYGRDIVPGDWGVVTTLQLRIVHHCNAGKTMILPPEIVYIHVFSDEDLVGNTGGVPIYEYNSDLAPQ
ncbi:hypothetical protein AAVH_20982 [Aphelenchoides avenae]|nr:hypothetical protein AAVH_20982 [Aphelenchus avenae]